MQEINNARQESSAQSSEPKENRCLVCDGPVQRPYLVCRACSYRELQQQRWESYLEFVGSDDTTPGNRASTARHGHNQRISRERPVMIVLCGPSHAGKSTFARGLHGDFKAISSDGIRTRLAGSFRNSKDEAEVWKVFEARKRRALREGRSVILDSCHMSKRTRWHSLEGVTDSHTKICVIFETPWRK
jgi:hypothetical protein